ncbi:MAG: patatin-like phospholipase family protein [Bacteroidetes bacterium]|nr:patatin-like phospholipase family protein [Bacteroidota bacterium]
MRFQNHIYRFIFFSLFLLIAIGIPSAFSQKVGVVLSGGGASGLSHIGVLKALEENNIPIDYISGSSIGAFVGALYSTGYSPRQMEQIVLSDDFSNWAYGNIDKKYVYYFKKKDNNASWISLKLSLDTAIETNLPTNLVSPASIDFSLMENMAPASAAANYNFDSLFIPFRCVAADIEAKKSVVFNKGDLGEAVRASISYPFYLKPITVDGKLLFDGGIYNNFPSNVMYEQCFPDIIIGSNVSGNVPAPDEDNLISQLKTMLINRTTYDIQCPNGILIEPKVSSSTFDFSNPKAQIDSGYIATMRQIETIKNRITLRVDSTQLADRRKKFINKEPKLAFGDIYISGLKKNQAQYVRGVLRKKGKTIPLGKFKPAYFRLVEDDKIKQIYPKAKFNPENRNYDLFLKMKKERDIVAEMGGNISNRPISEVFAAFEYKYLGNIGISAMANGYFGKLYASAQTKVRIDFPFTVPFYIEPVLTFNRWDFFKSSNLFFEDVKPAYLIESDQYAYMNLAMPLSNKDKMVMGGGLATTIDKYYQTSLFTQKDTPDVTTFDMVTAHLLLERNTLNRKQYATQGTYLAFKTRYVQGEELTEPGSTSTLDRLRKIHEWLQVKFVFDNYYKQKGIIRMGLYIEGVHIQSLNSPTLFFNNYTATLLASPSFQPLAESKTLFQPNFHAHTYAAFGLKNIITIKNRFDLRLEGYVYQPYQQIEQGLNNAPVYSAPFLRRYFIGTATLVGHTPIGPISFSLNYYHEEEPHPFSFLFHFGYIIFNNKSTD